MDATTSASPEKELWSNVLDLVLRKVLLVQIFKKTSSFEEVDKKWQCTHSPLIEFIVHEMSAKSFSAAYLKSSVSTPRIGLERDCLHRSFLLLNRVSTIWIRAKSR